MLTKTPKRGISQKTMKAITPFEHKKNLDIFTRNLHMVEDGKISKVYYKEIQNLDFLYDNYLTHISNLREVLDEYHAKTANLRELYKAGKSIQK